MRNNFNGNSDFFSPPPGGKHKAPQRPRAAAAESRRGGGGFVRIVRMRERPEGNLLSVLLNRVGNEIDEESAAAIIEHLHDCKLVTLNEALLMRSAVAQNALALPISAKNVLRAAVLRNMLQQVFRNAERGEGHDHV